MGYAFDMARLEAAVASLYGGAAAAAQRERYRGLLRGLEETFGHREDIAVFSAPGRTEIGGNHTDHQHGKVLAGSVNLDVIAAVTPNGEDVIRVKSEGFPLFAVELGDLSVREEERNTSAALVRGVAAWFKGHGCTLEGFDAYLTSNVLKGSGLSSSAAFEVLIGNILNDLFFDGKCTAVELAQIGQYAA